MPSSSPARPAAEKTLLTILNGAPMFPPFPGLLFQQPIPGSQLTMPYAPALGQAPGTGILTSTGTAVNNVTTATQFAAGVLQPDGVTRTLLGSMAGRVYLVQAIAAGFLMGSESPKIGTGDYWTVATQTTVPPVGGTFPGVPLAAGEKCTIIMQPTQGWLQWISSSGTASLVCTEML